MRRLRDVADATRIALESRPPRRNQLNRLAERQQSARQTGNVSPYSGRRQVERAAIDADAEGLQNGLMNLQVQPPDRPIQAYWTSRIRYSTFPLIEGLLRITSSIE